MEWDWFWNGLDRGLKSTFEWPNQMIMRALRVAQDPTVDFFDEKGFADWAVIPGFVGMFDKDPQYVGSREIFDRTAGRLGVKHNWATEFAASLVTDPLFYMTSGLTGAAKAARAGHKALGTWSVLKKVGAGAAEDMSVGQARATLRGILEAGETASRADRRLIQRGLAKLDEIGEGADKMRWADFAAQSSQRELRMGLPILHNYGAGVRVAPGYSSWFKLLNDKVRSPVWSAVGAAASGTVGRSALVRRAFDNSFGLWGDFKDGFARRGTLTEVFIPQILGAEEEGVLAEALTPANRKFFHTVFGGSGVVARTEKFQRYLDKGKDPVYAAQKAFGGHGERVLSMFDDVEKASGTEALQKLSAWEGDYRAAVDHWGSALGSTSLTETGDALMAASEKGKLAVRAFNAGRKLGTQVTKTFDSDVGIRGLRESEAKFHSAAANYQRYVEAVGRDVLVPRMVNWAKENGMSVEQAERVVGEFAQMGSIQDEMLELQNLINLEGAASKEAVASLAHYSARYMRSAELLQSFALDGRESPYLRKLAKQMGEQFGSSLDDKAIAAVFEGPANEVIQEARDFTKHLDPTDPASHHILLTGGKELRGSYLQFIPTGQLEEHARKLERQAEALAGGKKGRMRSVDAEKVEADLKAVNEVLHRRSLGNPRSKYIRRPSEFETTKIPQPVRELRADPTLHEKPVDIGEGLMVGDEVNVGPTLRAALRLRSMSDEMGRVAKAAERGHNIDVGPEQYKEALDVVEEMTRAVEDIVFQGDAGVEMREALYQVRKQILSDHVAIGGLKLGGPVAYLPIMKTSEEHKILRELFDQRELHDMLETAMPQFAAMFRRTGDQFSLEDLNDLHRALTDRRLAQNPMAKVFKARLEAVGESLGIKSFKAFEDRPTLLLMNRLAQGRRGVTVRDFLLDSFNSPEANLHGGQVTHYVVGGKKVTVAEMRKLRPKFTDGEELITNVDDVALSSPEVEGIIIDMGNGESMLLGAEDIQMNRGLLSLGRPDFEHLMNPTTIGPRRGELVANAFALQAGRGSMGKGGLIDAGALLRDARRLEQLEGEYVMFGDKQVLNGLLGAVNGQFVHHNKLLRGFDHVNFAAKRWATVLKLPFHAFNFASTFAQAHSVGVSAHSTTAGFADAVRFMNSSRKVVDRYDAFALVTSPSKSATGWRFMSQEFLRYLRRNPEVAKEVENVEDLREMGMIWRQGNQYYPMSEIFEAFRPLFATASREGLRGGARVSESLFDLRKRAMGSGALNAARNVGNEALETSEIMSRLAVTFGAMRQGLRPADAVKRALLATVDYADLTSREREIGKRIAGFYTFARRYIPVAWRRFAEDPSYAATLAKIMTQDGLLEDRNGQLVMRVGKDKVLPIQRMIPQMDALRVVQSLVEMSAEAGKMFSSTLESIDRESSMAGRANPAISLGPVPTAVAKAAMGTVDPEHQGLDEATKDMYNLIWPLRVIFDPGDPFEEQTMLERFEEQVSPVPGRHAERKKAALRGQLRHVMYQIQDKLRQTDDHEEQRVLRAEARRLEEIFKQRYKEMDK